MGIKYHYQIFTTVLQIILALGDLQQLLYYLLTSSAVVIVFIKK